MPRAEGALGLGVFLLGQGEKKIDFWASQLWLRGGRWSSDVGSLCPVLGCLELGEGLEVRGGGLGVRTPEKTSSCGGEEDPSFSLSNSSIEPIDGIRLCFIRGLGCQGQFWTNWRSAWLHVWRSSSLFTKCPTFLSNLSFTSPHPKLSRGCAFPWALPLASRPHGPSWRCVAEKLCNLHRRVANFILSVYLKTQPLESSHQKLNHRRVTCYCGVH